MTEYSCLLNSNSVLQCRDRYFIVEERDHGSHTESSDDRTNAYKCGDCTRSPASQQEHTDSKQNTKKVRCDAYHPEFPQLPFIGANQCDSVIGGDSHISSHIKGGSKAKKDKAENKQDGPYGQSRGGKEHGKSILRIVHNVPQKEQVDKCGDTNTMPIKQQCKQEQCSIDDYIQCTEVNRNQRVNSTHK